MSGTSATTGRYSVRSYGKPKDAPSQAFDDLMGKSSPMKSTPAHTKWGNTKVVAVREGERKNVSEIIVVPKKARMELEDPFSFDEEKRSPEKSATISRTSSGTRLPGARIPVRKGLADWAKRSADKDAMEVEEEEVEEEKLEVKKTTRKEEEPRQYEYSHGLARSTRTYSRAPFQNLTSSATPSATPSGPPPTGPSEEVSRPPVLTRQAPEVETHLPSSNSPQMPDLHIQESEHKEDVDSDDDFFPPSFVKKPIKTYGGRCKAGPSSGSGSAVASTSSASVPAAAAPPVTRQAAPAPSTSTRLQTPATQSAPSTPSTPATLTPIRVVTSPSSVASSSPSPTQQQQQPMFLARVSPASSSSSPTSPTPQRLVSPQLSPRTLPRKRFTRYSDPKLLQEFKQRYEKQHREPDKLGKFTNSTVISHEEKKSGKGTTLIVVCKPKSTGEHEKKNDVVSKYFVSSTQNYRPKRQAGGAKRHYSRPVADTSDSDASNSNFEFGDGEGQYEGEKENVTSEHSQPSTSADAEDLIVESAPAAEQIEADIFEGIFSDDTEEAEPVSKKFKKDQNSEAEVASLVTGNKQQQEQQQPPSEPAKGVQKIFLSRNEKKDIPPPQPPREIIVVPSAPSLRPMGASGGGRQRWGIPKAKAQEKAAPPAKRYRIFKSRVKQTDKDAEEAKQEGSDSSNAAPTSDSQQSGSQDNPMPSSSQESESQNGETMMPVIATAMAVDSPAGSDSVGDASEDSQDLMPETVQLRPTAPAPTGPRRFFKSKTSSKVAAEEAATQGSPKKLGAKAKYNARSWAMEEGDETEPPKLTKEAPKSCLRDPVTEREMPKITRSVHWAHKDGEESYTSLRVSKEHKQLFTVVRNVKEAHECQESGETQEFTDDLDYLMDGLKSTEPISIRCLSCIQLAQKCMQPAFRMHLRAHGIVSKIFHQLQDCRSDPSLALCTAAIMFMLSQDRLNMDLEQDSLTLMLQLLEVNNDQEAGQDYPPSILKELERTTERVKNMCDPTKIDLDTISTGLLAMEALLSLTSRRAGEWFKEELRMHHGLDHIVELINQCSSKIQDDLVNNIDTYLSQIRRLDRCLRVLENISYVNADNVSCLIAYKDGLLVTLTCRMLRLFAECVPAHPLTLDPAENKEVKESAAYNLFTCFLALLRVMLNLSHDNDVCSKKMGQIEGVINCIMMCIVNVVHFAPAAQRFDILVLSLGLLINLVEHCPANRQQLLESTVIIQDEGQAPQTSSALEVLIDLFCQREEAARQMESEADTETPAVEDAANKSGEWKETEAGVQWVIASAKKVREAEQAEKKEEAKSSKEEDEEETFMKALHKAGKHMEDSIVAAYVALVLGCLIQQNEDYISLVKCHLPNEDFGPMVYFLQKFLSFMSMTTALGSSGAERISSVIESLKKCAGIQSDP